MKFLAALIGFISLPALAVAATYDIDTIIAERRAEAERQRAKTMQMIEQRRSNPLGYYATPGEVRSISFKASDDGHFYVPAQVDGGQVRFLADTGASSVFITQEDARNIGIDVSNLNYSVRMQTANGVALAAETTVKKFKVGPIEVENMPVNIARERGGISLLGMTFFKRLPKYNVENNTLTLYK